MRLGKARRLAAVTLITATTGLAAVAPAPALAATTIAVTTLGDSANAADGECSLREAIGAVVDQAPSGGVPGECPGGSGTDIITFKVGGTIALTSSLPAISTTGTVTIDGADVITVDGQDAYALLDLTAGTFFIRNLVLAHGKGTGGYANFSSGTTTLTNVVIRDCWSAGSGGGIRSEGSLTLDRVRITGNESYGGGGGVLQSGGSLRITSSRVDNNTVNFGMGSYGGGVWALNAAVTIDGTRIDTNTANDGAGIAAQVSTVSITNSRIDHNAGTLGGGIYVKGVSGVTLTGSTIDANTSTDGGGLYSANDILAHYTIRSSTFSGNVASGTGNGGAIAGWWDWMDVRTSTFSGNSAYEGGAVRQNNANATSFVNSTFVGNSSAVHSGAVSATAGTIVLLHVTVTGNTTGCNDSCGAVEVFPMYSGSIILRNSIVAGNKNGLGSFGFDVSGKVVPATDNVTGTAVGVLDPAGLKDNGGPTKTVALLKTAIAAIGKASDGDGCGNANVQGVDQRGVTRPIGSCDIGAVELETKAPTASSPKGVPAVGSAIGSTVPVRITAGWSDPGGSGVKRFVLQKSVNGGSWSTVTSTMPAAGVTLKLATGSSYRFRVKPVDYDGNTGSYTSAGTIGTPAIRQQTSATFSGSWSSTSSTSYSGGSARRSSSAGASAKYTFTGRAIGFVTTFGPDRGKARIYVDGVLKATVDLYAASTKYKVVAWSARFSSSSSHTVKVVVVGTPSRARVDIDAFTVLR